MWALRLGSYSRRQHGGGHAFFALEIDDAVLLPVAAAAMADGDTAVAVAAGLFVQRSQQALFRFYFDSTL